MNCLEDETMKTKPLFTSKYILDERITNQLNLWKANAGSLEGQRQELHKTRRIYLIFQPLRECDCTIYSLKEKNNSYTFLFYDPKHMRQQIRSESSFKNLEWPINKKQR